MSPALSTYLHVVRFAAALVVFAHHASYPRFGGHWIAWLSDYGHEAVVVFFVLSGYVISFVTGTKEGALPEYAASRLSRLWSVALPALLLTAAFDEVGRALYPALYAGLDTGWSGYVASALFFNESWSAGFKPGSNIPFWSLSYEFTYYLAYGALVFCPAGWLAAGVCLFLAGPGIVLLLPAWAMGVVVHRLSHQSLRQRVAITLALMGALLALATAMSKVGNQYITWRWKRLLGEEHFELLGYGGAFVSDNLIALGVAAHLLGMAHVVKNIAVPPAFFRCVQRVADSTFCIYLLHYPSLYVFTALSVYVTGQLHGPAIGLASLTVGFALTPPTEWLRKRMRRWLYSLMS